MKTITMNGMIYRSTTESVGSNYGGGWEFLYKGQWHMVLNFSIRKQLNDLLK